MLETFINLTALRFAKSGESESDTSKVLSNALLRHGISEAAWAALEATPEIKSDLKEFTMTIASD